MRSRDFGALETTAADQDFLVELRGFEPLTSGEQAPARCSGAVAVLHGPPPEARPGSDARLALFTCPASTQRFERLVGLDENCWAACRGLVAADDHIHVERVQLDPAAH